MVQVIQIISFRTTMVNLIRFLQKNLNNIKDFSETAAVKDH